MSAGQYRDTGASRTGLGAWWWQRLSALYLAGFLVAAVTWLVAAPPTDFYQWRARLADPVVRLALLLFFAAFAVHAYVGLRDVILDYVPPRWLRVGLMGGVTLALAAFGGWGLLWLARL